MLNISQNRISRDFEQERYYSFQEVLYIPLARSLAYWLVGILVGFLVLLFFPWTQNITAKGNLTALQPNQRPQTIESTIDGRIERWFVSEGDTVQPGDTIVFLSEIKDDYFDSLLVPRTEGQAIAKENSAESYQEKAKALAQQVEFLMAIMELKVDQLTNKVEQAELKVVSDSIDLVAADIALEIAEIQLARWDSLFNKVGSKSRTEFEAKRNKQQDAQAKRLSQSNKLNIARRELINARIELRNVRNEYQEKIAKARSDRQSALSSQFDSEASAMKLRIQASNYEQRVDFRYITAPQRGFVNRALKPGIGETVKAGEAVVSILPLNYDLAADEERRNSPP